ncbi:MAG TPA: ribonuclease J [Candidatus Paceibacterota bacterium]|nr:ribonuclease J [Candidatus Paceibacterota bacterium]
MITQTKQENLRLIPLGGLGEVGRNMMLLEYKSSILIIDVGFRMPGEDMPGIDYIVPNINYLKDKKKNVVGIVFTHGHYDHIGAVPYLIEKIWHPKLEIFASSLTRGIIIRRQEDFPNQPPLNINEVKNGSKIKLGPFKIEFFRQNHNIPDNLGLFIETPVGNILHTSDFKFDPTPINDLPTDFNKLKTMANRKILLMLSDSTGAEEENHSLSEKTIEKNLEEIFEKATGRIIAATFASLINRVQQIIALSEKYGRKVIIEGYSMKTNVEICKVLGFIKSKKGTIIKAKDAHRYPDSKITILCTGAQGEGSAVLMRMATREHRFIRLKKGDNIILSSSVIPGNERTVQNLKDDILRQGCRVFHYKMMDIHAGGHAQKEELMEMIKIIKPTFFIPIHGQYSMLASHAEIAKEAGIPEKNIVVAENGQIIDLTQKKISVEKSWVPSNYIMVDGLGIGDVGEIVLRDRQMLSKDGMFVIVVVVDKQTGKVKGSPDIISRGFVYLRESKELLKDTRKKVVEIIHHATDSGGAVNWSYIKDEMRNKIGQFFYTKTKRRPMILPVVIEV